jgi:hypothetical protein
MAIPVVAALIFDMTILNPNPLLSGERAVFWIFLDTDMGIKIH